jgi:photosystem II stability/assembly factor-like uncharacterized protein
MLIVIVYFSRVTNRLNRFWLRALFILITACNYHGATAQWVKLNEDPRYIFTSIQFLNPDTGFIAGGEVFSPYSSVILRTLNAGDSWDTSKINPGFFVMDIHFINNSVGYVGGQDGIIFKTIDMGLTWVPINYCLSPLDFYNFYFLAEDSAYIQNSYGDLLLYNNALHPYCTHHFSALTSTRFPGTGALEFLSYNDGYIAGGYGKFARTWDRGLTWLFYNCDTNIFVLGARMTNLAHGVIVGTKGKVTVTKNGGVTWSAPQTISKHSILDVDFYTSQTGYCVGGTDSYSVHPFGSPGTGIIWRTDDGGMTWAVVDSGYTDQLNAIKVIHDSLAFAVGHRGLVLRNKTNPVKIKEAEPIMFEAIKITPNPFYDELQISHTAMSAGSIVISIYNLLGILVFRKSFGIRSGKNIISINLNENNLSNGAYISNITTEGHLHSKKLIKLSRQ